jgi:hypothetical protein
MTERKCDNCKHRSAWRAERYGMSPARMMREATRLAKVFDARTEDSHDVIDAATLLPKLVDALEAYYLAPDAAHEASQGADMQAAWLEERANNEPQPSKRAELIRRARVALAVADKLRGLSAAQPPTPQPAAQPLTEARIIDIRDEHLPSQGESFDCLAYARAIERAHGIGQEGETR